MANSSNAHTYRLYFFNDQLFVFLNLFAAMCKEGLLCHDFYQPCNPYGYLNFFANFTNYFRFTTLPKKGNCEV
jgi:hypothetical protein